jgi:hypothetical protein
MRHFTFLFFLSTLISINTANSQVDSTHISETPKPRVTEDKVLRYNLNDKGTHWFQVTFLNQTWVRYNQSNPGSTVLTQPKENTFDIGLRRTRIQMFGQITDRAFLYFQYGLNNFNFLYNGQGSGNRIIQAYFHDALCEYRLSNKRQLVIGAGLTIANGLSRFSNPSVGTILSLDLPIFAQATVNATDELSRKFSVYARGQVGKIDYRFILSDPFPAAQGFSGNSAFTTLPGIYSGSKTNNITNVANFAGKRHYLQQQAYVIYQFFEHESHTTPYMTGTYLGEKKVFNIAGGIIYQKDAMWKQTGPALGDTAYQDMLLWAVESFLDMPINRENGTGVSAYLGYFNTNYGSNYVRTQQQMNPADGSALPPFNNSVSKGGNGWPMFGTGHVIYSQAGYLFKRDLLGKQGTLQPYVTYQRNSFKALANPANVYDVGINWLMNGHKSKLSLDYQNRPIYDNTSVGDPSGVKPKVSGRRGAVILQYQIYI